MKLGNKERSVKLVFYTSHGGPALLLNIILQKVVQQAPESIITAVDCQNQVRSWRLLRWLMEFLIPTCKCAFVEEHEEADSNKLSQPSYLHQPSSKRHTFRFSTSTKNNNNIITVIGTMFGYRGGNIFFCIQTDHSSSPCLLLELVVPNKTLAREMQGGVLHIELKNQTLGRQNGVVWTMYCNMKKAGYAVKRGATEEDLEMIRLLGSVEIGAGTVGKGRKELMYLRARFERACGPSDVESFQLIDPEGYIGQELSITFHG